MIELFTGQADLKTGLICPGIDPVLFLDYSKIFLQIPLVFFCQIPQQTADTYPAVRLTCLTAVFEIDHFCFLSGVSFRRRITNTYINILRVVAEGLSEDGKTTDMFRVFFNGKTEFNYAVAVQFKLIDTDI